MNTSKDYMRNKALTKNTTYLSQSFKRVLAYPSTSPKKFEDWIAFSGASVIGSN
jgi:hypothetical protein